MDFILASMWIAVMGFIGGLAWLVIFWIVAGSIALVCWAWTKIVEVFRKKEQPRSAPKDTPLD